MDKRYISGAATAVLLPALGATALVSSRPDWAPFEVFALLLVIAVVSDAFPLEFRQIRITGSFLAIVLAATLLGPAPAVVIGVSTVLSDTIRTRPGLMRGLVNFATYSAFPLLSGLAAQAVAPLVAPDGFYFGVVVLGVFMVAITINFVLITAAMAAATGVNMLRQARVAFLPLLHVHFATGMIAAGVALPYAQLGIAVLGLRAIAGLVFQILLRTTFDSIGRGEQLQQRTEELASLQVGLLTAVLQTLSLRDRMTARHSAAVARYTKSIAEELGLDDEQQDLAHTAGLLHDIGKFIFPDSILFADTKLSDDDFAIIRRHPEEGARIVRMLEGQVAVAEIIHAHHERVDGRGYPRGLAGEEVPRLSRMISIADTYDVMTARDSYRDPVSSAEAVAELRRVSGAQLDGELVEIFVREVLGHEDTAFAHGDDADFEAELARGRDAVADAAMMGLASAGDAEPQLSAV